MKCPECGKNNPEGSKFCQHCGAVLHVPHTVKTDEQSDDVLRVDNSPYPYVISISKLVILSTTTFGLYNIYWFYKQWKSFKAERKLNVTPLARAIFAGFMSYSLFRDVSKAVRSVDKTNRGLEAGGLAVAYFILLSLWRLPGAYSWLGIFSVLPLISAQKAINFYWKEKYKNKEIVRSNFGLWNWIFTVIGGIVLMLGLYGTFGSSSSTNNTTNTPSELTSVSPTPIDVQALILSNEQSVVHIICDNGYAGSGTVWTKDGLIVTNNHVITGSTSCLVTVPNVSTGEPIAIYEASPIIAPVLSEQYDIAILSVYGAYRDSHGKVWGKYPVSLQAFFPRNGCSQLQLGDSIRIYGYPVTSQNLNLTVTDGIISNFADDGSILTSAKVDSGNSGGLAIDKDGCMVGIPSAVMSGNYQNLGVIIPTNVILDFIDKASKQKPNTNSQPSTNTDTTQTYQTQSGNSDNPPAGGYQNYGWYMHNGSSMQYVDGNWYSTPQQGITPTPTTSWWGF